jgi:DnaJ-class molecular chaperone
MRWKGLLIGALLGLVVFRFRPHGLVLGAALGALFDYLASRKAVEPPAPPVPAADDPYRTLEVAPTATDEEIEAAYRRLIAQYHPDRIAGAADEIRTLAETRARAINAAYEQLQKIRKPSR